MNVEKLIDELGRLPKKMLVVIPRAEGADNIQDVCVIRVRPAINEQRLMGAFEIAGLGEKGDTENAVFLNS